MIGLLISILLLWLITKYVPHGDVIVAIVVGAFVLDFLGLLPIIII